MDCSFALFFNLRFGTCFGIFLHHRIGVLLLHWEIHFSLIQLFLIFRESIHQSTHTTIQAARRVLGCVSYSSDNIAPTVSINGSEDDMSLFANFFHKIGSEIARFDDFCNSPLQNRKALNLATQRECEKLQEAPIKGLRSTFISRTVCIESLFQSSDSL